MSDTYQTNYPGWTDDQWQRVSNLVATEAERTRVAARYLPLYGPVDPSVVAVPNYLLGDRPNTNVSLSLAANRLEVNSDPDLRLTKISVLVPLATHEVAEPELQAASVLFRRAALTIARIEDALIFNGQFARNAPPPPTLPGFWLSGVPPVYAVTGGMSQAGLVPTGAMPYAPPPQVNIPPRIGVPLPRPPGPPARPPLGAGRQKYMSDWGEIIVREISNAIGQLEGKGHSGPFACFLSPEVFEAVHTPSPASMVLPRDRIIPFLGGEYLSRSNTIPEGYGVVIAGVPMDLGDQRRRASVGGGPVEIVVAKDISLRYLQQTPEPRFLFRISEKVVLRVKEWDAVAVLHPQ